MLKIFVTKNINDEKIIIFSDSNSSTNDYNNNLKGCAVYREDGNKLGYTHIWNRDYFKEVLKGEKVNINLPRNIFYDNKIHIKSPDEESEKNCIVDLKNKKLIMDADVDDTSDNDVKLEFIVDNVDS